ncbi:MAG: hypothetical protein QW404_03445 [Candidatus Nanoarchaeia archaeon]
MAKNDKQPTPKKLGELVEEFNTIDVMNKDFNANKKLHQYVDVEGLGRGGLAAISAMAELKESLEAAEGDRNQIATAIAEYNQAIGTRVIPDAIMARNGKKHVEYLENVLEMPEKAMYEFTIGIGNMYYQTMTGARRRRR